MVAVNRDARRRGEKTETESPTYKDNKYPETRAEDEQKKQRFTAFGASKFFGFALFNASAGRGIIFVQNNFIRCFIRALGKRIVRRVGKDGAGTVEEETQIKVKFLLMDSPTAPARNDNNYRTGFYVLKYRAESVDGTKKSPLVLLSDERTAGDNLSVAVSQNRSETNADKQ